MRILVVGLDCAAPEILFGLDDLPTIRRLMDWGTWGRLESVVPPITVPAWMCMATSQDPGSLGVYGFRNRSGHGYDDLETVDARAFREVTIWDQIAREGGRSILVGVPPSYPPRRLNGLSVGCFLTPDPARDVYTHPPELAHRIRSWVGDYPVDVADFRTHDKARLRDDIVAMTRTHFEVVRRLMSEEPWDYFQFVEIGLDRMHHGFWKHHDPAHPQHDPNGPWRDVIHDYYRLLDRELESVLALVDHGTTVLVVSDHGARPLEGGICVNEWLVREGWLVLHERPQSPTAFDELRVDWAKTRAWSTGGYYARVFLNVRGREPEGVIEAGDVERVRDELAAALEAIPGPDGGALDTTAFRPERLYRSVRGIAPDLLVHFDGLARRAVGGVGYGSVHVDENDTGPDDCNHAQHGAFILAGPHLVPAGEIGGAHLLDMAPTLLEAGGYEVPPGMQGRSLVGATRREPGSHVPDDAGRALVRERLRGLGYIA